MPSAQAAPAAATPTAPRAAASVASAGQQAAPAASAGQQDVAKLAARLESRLGTRSAGSYLDKASGKLIVTVTDSSAAQDVRRAGAVPRMVARGGTELKAATDELLRSARIPGVGWAIDPVSNQVLVSIDDTVTGAKLAKLKSVVARLGGAARIQSVGGTLRPLDMLDGSPIYATGPGRCSLGFNVFPFGGGEHYFITAGHCTQLGSAWYADSGLRSFLGTNSGPGVYGLGGDYGFVHYEGVGIRAYGTIAGTRLFAATWGTAFVGENIQRSGSSTGVRSGVVLALNFTANFSNGVTVTGLIETSACGEPGDSGGPMYSQFSADSVVALGITSGGMGNCSSGGMTVFQPLAPLMQNGALQLWDTPQP